MPVLYPKISKTYTGAFNNYLDKMRGEGVKKRVFVHAQGIKTVHDVGGGVKKWQNSDHVVVNCPPSTMALLHCILLKYLNLH